MTDSRYDSPSSIAIKSKVESPGKATARPVGVSILAVLHFVGGVGAVLLFGVLSLLFLPSASANVESMHDTLRSIGIPPALLVIGVLFLAILTIASGVGMWIGTKWGWWLAAFYYVYGIFRNGSALINVIAMADQFQGSSHGLEYYIVKHGGRIVVYFLLFLYFFKGNVLEYSGLEALNKVKVVGVLVGICTAITVAVAAITLMSI